MHLGVGRRDRPQLALLFQGLDQALLQDRAALLVGEPAAPFLLRHEPGRAQLCLELGDRGELLAHVLHRLLDRVLDFLIGHLDGGVALGLLHQQLFIHHLRQDLAPRRVPPRGVFRDLRPLRLRQHQLLFDLRGEDRLRPHHRDDAVHGARRRRAALRRRRRCHERGPYHGRERHPGGPHVSSAPAWRRCRPRRVAGRTRASGVAAESSRSSGDSRSSPSSRPTPESCSARTWRQSSAVSPTPAESTCSSSKSRWASSLTNWVSWSSDAVAMPRTSLGSRASSQRARSFTRNVPPRNVASVCPSSRAVTICGPAWRTRAGAPLSTLSWRAFVRLSKYSESSRFARELSKSTRNESRTSASGGRRMM